MLPVKLDHIKYIIKGLEELKTRTSQYAYGSSSSASPVSMIMREIIVEIDENQEVIAILNALSGFNNKDFIDYESSIESHLTNTSFNDQVEVYYPSSHTENGNILKIFSDFIISTVFNLGSNEAHTVYNFDYKNQISVFFEKINTKLPEGVIIKQELQKFLFYKLSELKTQEGLYKIERSFEINNAELREIRDSSLISLFSLPDNILTNLANYVRIMSWKEISWKDLSKYSKPIKFIWKIIWEVLLYLLILITRIPSWGVMMFSLIGGLSLLAYATIAKMGVFTINYDFNRGKFAFFVEELGPRFILVTAFAYLISFCARNYSHTVNIYLVSRQKIAILNSIPSYLVALRNFGVQPSDLPNYISPIMFQTLKVENTGYLKQNQVSIDKFNLLEDSISRLASEVSSIPNHKK